MGVTMNQQRLLRKVTRHGLLHRAKTLSPLSFFFTINLLGSIIALLSGVLAVALVLATASAGSVACLLRRRQHGKSFIQPFRPNRVGW
jgi:hypothetical protein